MAGGGDKGAGRRKLPTCQRPVKTERNEMRLRRGVASHRTRHSFTRSAVHPSVFGVRNTSLSGVCQPQDAKQRLVPFAKQGCQSQSVQVSSDRLTDVADGMSVRMVPRFAWLAALINCCCRYMHTQLLHDRGTRLGRRVACRNL